MRNPGKDNSFIEVEVLDERLTESKKEDLEFKKREILDNIEVQDGLTPEQKRVLGLEKDNGEDPYTFTAYLTEDDIEIFTYKKYIRKDLRVMITNKGEEDKSFLDIDGEVAEVKDKVEDLLKKFAQ